MSQAKNSHTIWGIDNPHPLALLRTELVWEGKYDESGTRRPIRLPTTPLPLQRIENNGRTTRPRKGSADQPVR
jgi:hypothetical protein